MKNQLKKIAYRLLVDESGPTAAEYAVMLALIVAVCLASVQTLTNATSDSLESSSQAITDALNR